MSEFCCVNTCETADCVRASGESGGCRDPRSLGAPEMVNATQPPRRMRFSFESRCRLVSLVLAGQSPQAAAAACGASRANGLSALVSLPRRWLVRVGRSAVPRRLPRRLWPELEHQILAAREFAKAGSVIVAGRLGPPASTVWKVLCRHGVSRLPLPARESSGVYAGCTPLSLWVFGRHRGRARSLDSCAPARLGAPGGDTGSTLVMKSVRAKRKLLPPCDDRIPQLRSLQRQDRAVARAR
jgi:hypothetical protein